VQSACPWGSGIGGLTKHRKKSAKLTAHSGPRRISRFFVPWPRSIKHGCRLLFNSVWLAGPPNLRATLPCTNGYGHSIGMAARNIRLWRSGCDEHRASEMATAAWPWVGFSAARRAVSTRNDGSEPPKPALGQGTAEWLFRASDGSVRWCWTSMSMPRQRVRDIYAEADSVLHERRRLPYDGTTGTDAAAAPSACRSALNDAGLMPIRWLISRPMALDLRERSGRD